MPGCGKSTVGRHLAKHLGWSFVDADVEIERDLGHTIREHFDRFGEVSFRDVEQRVLAQLLDRGDPLVLATGGGAVLREANREAMRGSGHVVIYLCAALEELVRRLRQDVSRPLLQGVDPALRLRELFRVRDPLYRETAGMVLETGRSTVSQLVAQLSGRLAPAGGVGGSYTPAHDSQHAQAPGTGEGTHRPG
ncbi:shikimate kinase [Ideonella sp. TBM-1]|uniref:Shikimate kinase n=2 Tax=Ideonella livida TaxID=2707176 RepID=A0A7C9TKC0_9BURK|nr:shikimate kinase [Ideonella livida]